MEKKVLQLCNVSVQYVKLVAGGVAGQALGQVAFRGHIVTVENNAALEFCKSVPQTDVSKLVQVIFIGKRQTWNDKGKLYLKSNRQFSIRADVVMSTIVLYYNNYFCPNSFCDV
jgi:hypothetical protein